MAKVWASAPGEQQRAGAFRAAREEGGDRPTGAEPALDADMLDIVQRFEKGYAELAPAAEWLQPQVAGGEELFPEFPDIFEDSRPGKAAPAESARVVPMPRREVEPPAPAPSPAPSSSASSPFLSRTREPVADVDLDEAMAILRASERRAHPAPQPGADDEPEEAPAPAFKAAPPELRPRRPKASERREPDAADGAAPATNWSSKAHTTRTVAMIAAVVALAAGVVGGYFLGGGPAVKSSGVIESSKQGGTQLRLERNLPQR